jgi:hypothetical protein
MKSDIKSLWFPIVLISAVLGVNSNGNAWSTKCVPPTWSLGKTHFSSDIGDTGGAEEDDKWESCNLSGDGTREYGLSGCYLGTMFLITPVLEE